MANLDLYANSKKCSLAQFLLQHNVMLLIKKLHWSICSMQVYIPARLLGKKKGKNSVIMATEDVMISALITS